MATDRDDIRQAVDKLAQAIRRKDAAAVMALHAAEPVIYDLAPPLANSRTAARDPSRLEAWFATWRGDIAYEQRDLVIHQDGDLAVCHGFLRIGGTKVDGDGTATSVWTRQTLALRRGGRLADLPCPRIRALPHGWQPARRRRTAALTAPRTKENDDDRDQARPVADPADRCLSRAVLPRLDAASAGMVGPHGMTTPVCEMDLRAGGVMRTVMRAPDGSEYPHQGVFLEVTAPRRIVMTDAFGAGWRPAGKPFMVGVSTFEPEGNGTRYTAGAMHWNEEDIKAHEAMGFHDGWGQSADRFEAVIARLKAEGGR